MFIAYPKAVSQMPWAPVWAVLFFFMILLMGLDSQFVGVEGFITAVVDLFPRQLRRKNRRELFILAVSVFSFAIGLFMVTKVSYIIFSRPGRYFIEKEQTKSFKKRPNSAGLLIFKSDLR